MIKGGGQGGLKRKKLLTPSICGHMRYFSDVVGGGGMNFCEFLRLALFCNMALTGETLHSAEVLY